MIDRAVLVVAWAGRVVRRAATTLARVETALVALRDADEPEWRVEPTAPSDDAWLCARCVEWNTETECRSCERPISLARAYDPDGIIARATQNRERVS
jgi:hypothetical protein